MFLENVLQSIKYDTHSKVSITIKYNDNKNTIVYEKRFWAKTVCQPKLYYNTTIKSHNNDYNIYIKLF